MVTLGELIRQLRESKGWTQGQLAYRSGLSESAVSMIERGNRTNAWADTIGKLSDALGVSADFILLETGLKSEQNAHLEPSPAEAKLVETVRQIPSGRIRMKVLELITGFAKIARDVDAAQQDGQA